MKFPICSGTREFSLPLDNILSQMSPVITSRSIHIYIWEGGFILVKVKETVCNSEFRHSRCVFRRIVLFINMDSGSTVFEILHLERRKMLFDDLSYHKTDQSHEVMEREIRKG